MFVIRLNVSCLVKDMNILVLIKIDEIKKNRRYLYSNLSGIEYSRIAQIIQQEDSSSERSIIEANQGWLTISVKESLSLAFLVRSLLSKSLS